MKSPGSRFVAREPGQGPVQTSGQDDASKRRCETHRKTDAMTQISELPATAQGAPPESLLVGHIRAHIKQGEKAKERSDHAREKAEQHFISAGQYLITLKAAYAPSWEAWETMLKAKVGLSTGRASELMQLADGRKSLQQIRTGKAESVAKLRAQSSSLQSDVVKKSVSSRNEEIDEVEQALLRPSNFAITDDGQTIQGHRNIETYESKISERTEVANEHALVLDPTDKSPGAEALRLLRALIFSTAASRKAAGNFLANGFIQGKDFEAVREAVADLYAKLARMGR
jgi:hypothetical protein